MGGMRILAAAAPFLATAVGLTLGRNHNGIELSTQGRVVEGNAIQRTGRVLLQDSAARSDPDHGALADEKGYFTSLDTDKDGMLNRDEFKKHLKAAAAVQLPDEDDDAEADILIGKTVGRMWIDLHGEDADQEAFAGIDQDGDGALSWDEWVNELFHDQPQQPFYVDGELGEVMTDEQFRGFDKDLDGQLDIDEVQAFVNRFMAREEVDAQFTGLHPERDVSGKGGSLGLAYVFMFDFDKDKNHKVSLPEWSAGFKGVAEQRGPDSIVA